MKVFPYSLIRTGGGAFELFANFDTSQIQKVTTDLVRTRIKEREDREALCEQLLQYMQGLDDSAAQQAIQNLRRDIFKGKNIKDKVLEAAREHITGAEEKILTDYLQLKEQLEGQESAYEAAFAEALGSSREAFKQVAHDEKLQKGLILSSRVLLDRIPSYSKREALKFRKKENQVEQSLLKYATRMFTKTSPFSTFTNLSLMELGEHGDAAYQMSHEGREEGEKVVSHIRLNNYLFKYLYDLFLSYRDIYRHLLLRPNPTTEVREDHFFYLTNHANIESFQRIPFNDVVKLILDESSEGSGGIRYRELISNLMEYIDAEEADLEEYVNQLISYGLLEYNIGVSGIDPNWDQALVRVLEPLKEEQVPFMAELIDMLKAIRQQAEKYGEADLQERKTLLGEAYKTFTELAFRIHEAAGLPEEERLTPAEREAWFRKKKEEEEAKKEEEKPAEEEAKEEAEQEEDVFQIKSQTAWSYKPEQMFFEDTTRELKGTFDEASLKGIMTPLSDLMQELRWNNGQLIEREKMAAYFLQKYGTDAKVNLLTFYEEYYRDYKKPEREREEYDKRIKARKANADATNPDAIKEIEEEEKQGNKQTPPEPIKLELPKTDYRSKTMRQWNEAMEAKIEAAGVLAEDEVHITLDMVREVQKDLGIEAGANEDNNFFGSFIQFFQNEGNKGKDHFMAVANGTFSGYGKMLSRFMHIFDDEVTEELRRWNVGLKAEDEIYVEDCDASYFNANLHPPLMPFEIWMPGGHNSLPSDKQLPITDFEITYEEGKKELHLIHKPSSKRAYVFDLGFQGQMGRSQLFQLLEKFTGAAYYFTQPVTSVATTVYRKQNKPEETEEGKPVILKSPRVVLENKVILQRKTWLFPVELVPEREPNETDASYFNRVATWRHENDLPSEVFVFINPDRMGGGNVPHEKMKRLTRDDYKPQYINFDNPVLVLLFEKMMVKVPQTVKIQEMRPGSAELLQVDDKRYVTEFMVQWYNN